MVPPWRYIGRVDLQEAPAAAAPLLGTSGAHLDGCGSALVLVLPSALLQPKGKGCGQGVAPCKQRPKGNGRGDKTDGILAIY